MDGQDTTPAPALSVRRRYSERLHERGMPLPSLNGWAIPRVSVLLAGSYPTSSPRRRPYKPPSSHSLNGGGGVRQAVQCAMPRTLHGPLTGHHLPAVPQTRRRQLSLRLRAYPKSHAGGFRFPQSLAPLFLHHFPCFSPWLNRPSTSPEALGIAPLGRAGMGYFEGFLPFGQPALLKSATRLAITGTLRLAAASSAGRYFSNSGSMSTSALRVLTL